MALVRRVVLWVCLWESVVLCSIYGRTRTYFVVLSQLMPVGLPSWYVTHGVGCEDMVLLLQRLWYRGLVFSCSQALETWADHWDH